MTCPPLAILALVGCVDQGLVEAARVHSWTWISTWFAAFTQEWQRKFEVQEGALASVVMNPSVDLHWYHRNLDGLGPLHIVRLGVVCDSLRRTLDAAGIGAGVTCFESGTSTLASTDRAECHIPPGLTGERFQALDVWRRLGGAAWAYALVAGWHCWMSNYGEGGGAFDGMGLRDDSLDAGRQRRPRDAWFAYQRFTTIFQFWFAVRLAWPPTTDVLEKSAPTRYDLVVFEFIGMTGAEGAHAYGYLCLLDPWRDTPRLKVTAAPADGADTWYWHVATSPSSTRHVGTTGRLPAWEATWARSVPRALPGSGGTFTLALGDDVVVWLAHSRIHWSAA